jgi:hypothetical protein
LDDRFIGYRGSQENEWSWEPEKPKGPGIEGTRGARTIAFAVLTAFALVTSVLVGIYLVAGTGDSGGGPIVSATTTPTKRPTASPTASPTVRPTVVPATPAATATAKPTATPAPSPSPVPGTPRPSAELFLWNAKTGKWQADDLKQSSSSLSEGDAVLFLFKLSGVKPGETYEITIDYFDCGLSPGKSFDHLAAADAGGGAAQLAAPGPGRVTPDAQVPVPDDPGVANDSASTAYLALWGGTFPHATKLVATPATCAGDKRLTVPVLARASTLYLEWGGHLASAADWVNQGAASATSPFGMSATMADIGEARIELLPGAVSE